MQFQITTWRKTSLADAPAAMAIKVTRGGIKKYQIQIRERIPAMGKDQFFVHVLVTSNSNLLAARTRSVTALMPVSFHSHSKINGEPILLNIEDYDRQDSILIDLDSKETFHVVQAKLSGNVNYLYAKYSVVRFSFSVANAEFHAKLTQKPAAYCTVLMTEAIT